MINVRSSLTGSFRYRSTSSSKYRPWQKDRRPLRSKPGPPGIGAELAVRWRRCRRVSGPRCRVRACVAARQRALDQSRELILIRQVFHLPHLASDQQRCRMTCATPRDSALLQVDAGCDKNEAQAGFGKEIAYECVERLYDAARRPTLDDKISHLAAHAGRHQGRTDPVVRD